MPRAKKAVTPVTQVEVSTVSSLTQKFDVLFLAGRTLKDIERVSQFCGLEREFLEWQQQIQNKHLKQSHDPT